MSKRGAEASWIESRKRWQINVQRDGKRKTFVSGTPGRRGKHEAEAKADEWLESMSDDMSSESAWAIFLSDVEKRTGKSNYRNYEIFGRRIFLPSVARKRISKLSTMDFQRMLDRAEDEGKKRQTILLYKSLIMAFINYGRKARWKVPQIDAMDLKVSDKLRTIPRQAFEPDDIKTIFAEDWIDYYGRHRTVHYIHEWRLMLLTGMRRSEACGLRWEDLDAGGSTLQIRRGINPDNEITEGKTGNAQRWVALSPRAKAVIADQKEYLKSIGMISPWIFPGKDGDRADPNLVYKAWITYRKQKGISRTLHEMRHTFISAVKSDMPIALLKEQVGHGADTDSIGIYGHVIDGDMDKISTVIDNVFERILE